LNIESLNWDDANIEHIARHQVTPAEVEDICFGSFIFTREASQRYILSGQSGSGRYLNVVIERIGKGVYRPITAFEMSEKYRRVYKRQTGR
jgi:uncharacterized DUF497 family protein